jgi:hypothetical protein
VVGEELRALEPGMWDQAQRVDYLALAWPVVDETFSPYSIFMYQMLAHVLHSGLFGPPTERGVSDKSDLGDDHG